MNFNNNNEFCLLPKTQCSCSGPLLIISEVTGPNKTYLTIALIISVFFMDSLSLALICLTSVKSQIFRIFAPPLDNMPSTSASTHCQSHPVQSLFTGKWLSIHRGDKCMRIWWRTCCNHPTAITFQKTCGCFCITGFFVCLFFCSFIDSVSPQQFILYLIWLVISSTDQGLLSTLAISGQGIDRILLNQHSEG